MFWLRGCSGCVDSSIIDLALNKQRHRTPEPLCTFCHSEKELMTETFAQHLDRLIQSRLVVQTGVSIDLSSLRLPVFCFMLSSLSTAAMPPSETCKNQHKQPEQIGHNPWKPHELSPYTVTTRRHWPRFMWVLFCQSDFTHIVQFVLSIKSRKSKMCPLVWFQDTCSGLPCILENQDIF